MRKNQNGFRLGFWFAVWWTICALVGLVVMGTLGWFLVQLALYLNRH